MREQTQAATGLTAIFLATVVLAALLMPMSPAPWSGLWNCLLILALMYGASLLLSIPLLRHLRADATRQREQALQAGQQLREAKLQFQDKLSHRTFELSVVNASLNREIAERIQAENETRALQRRLQLILDSTSEGIFGLDRQGRLTFANAAACDLLDWPLQALIGQAHHELVHHSRENGASFPIETCPIQRSCRHGDQVTVSHDHFWTRQGACLPVAYTGTPIIEDGRRVGAVVVFSDIRKRLQSEAERCRLQHRLQLTLDSAGLGIFGLDVHGRVEFVNRAALIMLGWTREELLGKSHHHLVHHTRADGSPYPEATCPITMAYRDGKVHFSSNDIFWGKDGTSFPVEYVSTPIREEQRLSGSVVTFRDLTTFT